MKILRICSALSIPVIALGLVALSVPHASAGGTSQRTCAAISNGVTVQANTGIDNLIIGPLNPGDTITVTVNQGNAAVITVSDQGNGGVLASLGAGDDPFVVEIGAQGPTDVGVSAFGQNEGNVGDSAFVTCAVAVNAPPPPEQLGAEALDAPSTEDVQRAFTSRQMMAHLTNLYEDMHRNTSGVLQGSAAPSVSQNSLFLQSAGKAAKDIPGAMPKLNVFVSADVTSFEGDSFDGLTGDLIVGLDYRVDRDIVVGGLVGVGRADFSTLINTNVGSLESTGLTVGVYAAAKVVGDLTIDGLVTYSGLSYDVANGTTTGDFDANRFGISVGIYNQLPFMGGTLEPHARVIYGHETQDGYTDSVGRGVGTNTVNAGRIVLGPRLIAPSINGFTPWISANGVYEFSDSGQLATGAPDFDDTFSGQVGLGFDWDSDLGRIGGEVEFGGLGSGLYHSVSGTVNYALDF